MPHLGSAALAGYAQSLRVARADLTRLRHQLPALLELHRRGAELPAAELLAARAALGRIDDLLAADPPSEGAEDLAGLIEEVTAARATLPADAVDVVGDHAPPTPGSLAAAGVEHASAPLPFHDQIQASFGRHDVSGVRTQTGGPAADASRALGARAFAFGDRVGFAGAPDLHTAAHEAAHVVQQRAGVALAGGEGAAGDVYEEHADAVADAVVEGRDAEPLLDTMAGAGGGEHAAVQRKDAGAKTAGATKKVTASEYAHAHRDRILVAIEQHLASYPLPNPHPRFAWTSAARGGKALAAQLRDHIHDDKGIAASNLYGLAPDVHLGRVIDDARYVAPRDVAAYGREDVAPKKTVPQMVQEAMDLAKNPPKLDFTDRSVPERRNPHHGPRGDATWYDEVGIAIANAIYPAIVESVHRMGGRFLAAFDADAKTIAKVGDTELITSLPIDRLVHDVLAIRGLMRHTAGDGAKDNAGGVRALGGARELTGVDWLGASDPKLRHWIRVTKPSDATSEDVVPFALKTYVHEVGGSQFDFTSVHVQKIHERASPPYFWVPFAPDRRVQRSTDTADDVNELGASSVADDVARAQARSAGLPRPDLTKTDPAALKALEVLPIQLAWLDEKLRPWGAAGTLMAGAVAFVKRRADEARSNPTAIAQWAPHLVAQERAVGMIGSQVSGLLGELAASKLDPTERAVIPSVRPVIDVLVAYAAAAGVSHLPAQLQRSLAEAYQQQQLMPLAMAELKLEDARHALVDQRDAQVSTGTLGADAQKNLHAVPGLATRMAKLRAQATRGGTVDQGELDQIGIESDALALRARLTRISLILGDIKKRADDVGVDAVLQKNNETIKKKVDGLNKDVDDVERQSLSHERTPEKRRDWQRLRIANTTEAIGRLDKLVDFSAHVEYMNDRIADEQLASLIRQMVLEIGVMLITGQIVGAGMAALRGIAMARRIAVAAELVGEMRSARAVFAAGEMVFQAGAQTLVQSGLRGKAPTRGEFAENLLGNAITAVAMKPFAKLFGDAKVLEAEVKTWSKAAKSSAKFVARGVIEGGVGIASSKVAHSIVTGEGMTGPDGQELTTQALSFLAGRMVARRAEAMNTRIEQAAKKFGDWHFAELRVHTRQLMLEAAGVGKSVAPDVSVRLLERHQKLLETERDAYKAVANDGHKVGTSDDAVELDLKARGADQAELPIRLAQLEPVVGGEVFRGTEIEVRDALAIAEKSGIPLVGTRENGVWTLKSGDRTFRVHEVPPKPGQKAMTHAAEPSIKKPVPYGAVKPGDLPELAKQLHVPKVEIAKHLEDGIEIVYAKEKKLVGYDLRVVAVYVGKNARVADILAHIPTVRRITEYNGLLAKLRGQYWQRFSAKNGKNPFREGSRGWEAVEEMRKLDFLMAERGNWDLKKVDLETINREIQFLESRRAYYEDIVRSAVETGVMGDATGSIAKDDVHKVTNEALNRKPPWPFPHRNGKPDFENYYYRHKDGSRNEYELVAMPNTDAPAKRVVEKNGKRVIVEGGDRPEALLLSTTLTPSKVIDRMWRDADFGPFAELALKHSKLTRDKIEEAIRKKYESARGRAKNDVFKWESLRSAVKEVVRAHVEPVIANATHAEMVKLIEPLGDGDRGNLAEHWYKKNHRNGATPHVDVRVKRHDKDGKPVENHNIDLVDGKEAIEIKHVTTKIEQDQYNAYVQLVTKGTSYKKLTYVFTEPKGALANIDHFIKELGGPMGDKLTVVVFINGRKRTITDVAEAKKAKADLAASVPP